MNIRPCQLRPLATAVLSVLLLAGCAGLDPEATAPEGASTLAAADVAEISSVELDIEAAALPPEIDFSPEEPIPSAGDTAVAKSDATPPPPPDNEGTELPAAIAPAAKILRQLDRDSSQFASTLGADTLVRQPSRPFPSQCGNATVEGPASSPIHQHLRKLLHTYRFLRQGEEQQSGAVLIIHIDRDEPKKINTVFNYAGHPVAARAEREVEGYFLCVPQRENPDDVDRADATAILQSLARRPFSLTESDSYSLDPFQPLAMERRYRRTDDRLAKQAAHRILRIAFQ